MRSISCPAAGVALRRLADENFNNDIVRALFRARPEIDIVRTQDAGLTGLDDEALLAWPREHQRLTSNTPGIGSPFMTRR